MLLKQKIYIACLQVVETKIAQFRASLLDLTQGAQNDSKSAAGDKHETARAMMQIEHEKISKQLEEVLLQKNKLTKIDVLQKPSQIIKGSLVKTNQGYLFVSIAIGKITVDTISVIVLSPQSPLGIKLMGLQVGETTTINGTNYSIESLS